MTIPFKPEKKTKTYFDYNQVTDYLEAKCGRQFRDYAGKFCPKFDESKPYQDFWHWILEHHQISNGCFITFSEFQYNEEEIFEDDWQREIYKMFLDEFADINGEIELYVDW